MHLGLVLALKGNNWIVLPYRVDNLLDGACVGGQISEGSGLVSRSQSV